MPHPIRLALAGLVWAPLVCTPQPTTERAPAVPVQPIPAIVDAFRTHEIVAIGAPHPTGPGRGFLLSLIGDPRFVEVVDDIVVEFGNARYQQTVDGYVRGERVPIEQLRRAWRDAVSPTDLSDALHEEWLRAVREVNARSTTGRRLRVLLGDPPIEWTAVRSRTEHWKWVEMRDAHPASVIQLEVLAKRRKALVVYGRGHLQRRQMLSNFDMQPWQAQTLVSLLERAGPVRVFIIWPLAGLERIQPDIAAWPVPSLSSIRGTVLGAADVATFWEDSSMAGTRFAVQDGRLVPIGREQWRTLQAEEQFDAVLHLGPKAPRAPEAWSPEICREPGLVEARLERLALAGLPPVEAERLKTLCARSADRPRR